MYLFKKLFRSRPPEACPACGNRIQDHRYSQPVGFFSGQDHGFCILDGAHVAHKGVRLLHRFRSFLLHMGHGGCSAGRQNNVGTVVHCNKIRNALDQRLPLPGHFQYFFITRHSQILIYMISVLKWPGRSYLSHRFSSSSILFRSPVRLKISTTQTPMAPPTTAAGV